MIHSEITKELILLFVSVALMFHTEIAFGVVFGLAIIVILIVQKVRPNFRQLGLAILVSSLLFIPHLIFEVKHNFLQTKSVIRFVTHFRDESNAISSNQHGVWRIAEIAQDIGGGFKQSFWPSIIPLPDWLAIFLAVGMIAFLRRKPQAKKYCDGVLLPLIITTFLCYLILPAKGFYFVALVPFWLVGDVLFLNQLPKLIKKSVIAILIFLAIVSAIQGRGIYQKIATTDAILFAPRLAAVNTAYKLAAGKPFSSYQYVPEVYDFTYQQIYQFSAQTEHRPLPTAFGYLPGKVAYNSWNHRQEYESDLTVLIVEKDDRPQFFPVWWQTITADKTILKSAKVNQAITVYLTEKKKN